MKRKVIDPEAERRARKLTEIMNASSGKVRVPVEEVVFPPFSTCCVCVNRLSDLCMEDCAPARDYRHFRLKAGIGLAVMPRFPLHEFVTDMPSKVRQVVVAIYLAKITDYLQGHVDDREGRHDNAKT